MLIDLRLTTKSTAPELASLLCAAEATEAKGALAAAEMPATIAHTIASVIAILTIDKYLVIICPPLPIVQSASH
jgi:creatinine amidohydrolase/Fe(II)-dependent formamide hydrolase-like protein